MCGYIPYLDQTLIVPSGTIEPSYCYSLKGNKLSPMGVAMTIQGSLICPVTGTLFMELPELPISNSDRTRCTLPVDEDVQTGY